MDAYSVDNRGNVLAATKNVKLKVRELMRAQEDLIIAKIFAGRHLSDSDPVAVTKPVAVNKRVNFHRSSKKRLEMFLVEYKKQFNSSRIPTQDTVRIVCARLKRDHKLSWCHTPSKAMLKTLVGFCVNNF